MTITKEQQARLNADLPADKVREREAGKDRDGNKRFVSYIEGHEVIDTLNAILGPAGWGYRATVKPVWDGLDEKGRFCCSYLGSCVLTVGDCVIEDVGAGHGIDYNPGQSHESAAKEASTDSLKRCAKSLGRRMGLALYDRTQAHVGPPEPMPLGDKARQLIMAINVAEDTQAKKNVLASVEAAWQSLRAHEQQVIEEAIEARKRKARGET